MSNTQINFKFKCPKPFNELQRQNEGSYFCGDCIKPVFDLSGKSREEVISFLEANKGACVRLEGSLISRFDKWRIGLLKKYTKFESRANGIVVFGKLGLIFFSLIIFLTQCRSVKRYHGVPNVKEGSTRTVFTVDSTNVD